MHCLTLGCFEPSRILLFQSRHNLFVWFWCFFCGGDLCIYPPTPRCLVCWCQASRSSFPKHFCKPVRKSLGVVLRFFLSSHSRKIWISKVRVWRGSWRAGVGVLPTALAVAGLGLRGHQGHLAGAWQTASPHGFPCWRLAGHGDLLSSWHGATQGLSWLWFSEAFCLASWLLTLG